MRVCWNRSNGQNSGLHRKPNRLHWLLGLGLQSPDHRAQRGRKQPKLKSSQEKHLAAEEDPDSHSFGTERAQNFTHNDLRYNTT